MADTPYTQQNADFWKTYLRGRASIPPSFWERIFTYHSASSKSSSSASNTLHHASFNTACDLGSGPGINSAALAARFSHVILLDPGAKGLEIAKSTLSPSSPSQSSSSGTATNDQYSYVVGTAESNTIPAESCDLIFAGNMLHHADAARSVPSIASKLRPGGTLVATIYGIPQFTNPKIHDVWSRISDHRVTRLREVYLTPGNKLSPNLNVPLMIEAQDSGYDSIAIPETLYEDITRLKLNVDIVAGEDEPFRMARGLRDELPLVSRVGQGDKFVEERDADWAFDMSAEEFQAFLDSFPFKELDHDLMRRLCDEALEAAKKDDGGRFKGFYAASVIMARKRGSS